MLVGDTHSLDALAGSGVRKSKQAGRAASSRREAAGNNGREKRGIRCGRYGIGGPDATGGWIRKAVAGSSNVMSSEVETSRVLTSTSNFLTIEITTKRDVSTSLDMTAWRGQRSGQFGNLFGHRSE
ncbi:hypothetical protein GCM10028821_05100 [Hymenobacter jeollabukensis]